MNGFCEAFQLTLVEAENKLREARESGCAYFKQKGKQDGQLHAVYFAIASLVLNGVKNILEIGTGLGESSRMLSRLFPLATVHTIDIPKQDPDYAKLSQRESLPPPRCKRFEENISRNNIKFIERNSFHLPTLDLPKEYSLIFVDGGHWWPTVAWDIMFSYSHLEDGGFMFMHDYYKCGKNCKNNVGAVVDYIKRIIREKIELLPSILNGVGQTAWLRKIKE